MARKERINLRRTDDFTVVDAELTDAMRALDETNTRIIGLLEEYRPHEEATPEADQAAADSASEEEPSPGEA